jgi:5-methylthioadenosine/S-adenosylhomocysteine deaminase
MTEICADFVVISPYKWIRNACVSFNTEVKEVEVVRGKLDKSRDDPVKIITHGMASAHTHLGLYPIRSTTALGLNLDNWVSMYAWPWERFLRENPDASYFTSIKAMKELLSGGVTAFADMHLNETSVARAANIVGLRADLSVAIMDGGVFNSYEEALDENLKLIKMSHSYPLINARLGPCTPRLLKPKDFKNIVDIAREEGVGLHTHLAEVEEDLLWLRKKWGMSLREFINYVGMDSVDVLVAHSIWISQAIDLIRNARSMWIVHTPRSNIGLGDGVTPIVPLLRDEGRVSIGVDVAPTYSLQHDMIALQSLHYGGGRPLQPELILSLATEGGYRALKIGSGDLVPGEPADIIVWETNDAIVQSPIPEITWGNAKVSEAFVSGIKVYSNGKLTRVKNLDEVNAKYLEFLNLFLTRI